MNANDTRRTHVCLLDVFFDNYTHGFVVKLT